MFDFYAAPFIRIDVFVLLLLLLLLARFRWYGAVALHQWLCRVALLRSYSAATMPLLLECSAAAL
jgi:hypothetical protein